MSSIDEQLHVEQGSYHTGNIHPLLHEIRHALRKLLDSGETTTIDLGSLPLAPGELQQLLETLGEGEVSAQLNALGTSTIIETRFAGVWLIVHTNSNEEEMGKFIEITRMPAILQTQTGDLEEALTALQTRLEEL